MTIAAPIVSSEGDLPSVVFEEGTFNLDTAVYLLEEDLTPDDMYMLSMMEFGVCSYRAIIAYFLLSGGTAFWFGFSCVVFFAL